MQVQRAEGFKSGSGEPGRFGYRNVFHGVYLIAQREGVLSLFKGTEGLTGGFSYFLNRLISKNILPYTSDGNFNGFIRIYSKCCTKSYVSLRVIV